MHPNARKFRVRSCSICGYEFSDEHHIHPEILGRKESPTLMLCPNHHRYAHILQSLVIAGESLEEIKKFADEYFDADFIDEALDDLLSTYGDLLAERNSRSDLILESLRVGDFVVVHARRYSFEHREYNECVGEVESLENQVVRLRLCGISEDFYPDEVKVLGNLPSTFVEATYKIQKLLAHPQLEELDRRILELYLRDQVFTETHLRRLNQIWTSYPAGELALADGADEDERE